MSNPFTSLAGVFMPDIPAGMEVVKGHRMSDICFHFQLEDKGGYTVEYPPDIVYEGDPEIEAFALDFTRRYYGMGPFVDFEKKGDWWTISGNYPVSDDEPGDLCGVGKSLDLAVEDILREIDKMEARLRIFRDIVLEKSTSLKQVEGDG